MLEMFPFNSKVSIVKCAPHSYLSRDKSQTIFNFESTAFTYSGPVSNSQSFFCAALVFGIDEIPAWTIFEKLNVLIDKHN